MDDADNKGYFEFSLRSSVLFAFKLLPQVFFNAKSAELRKVKYKGAIVIPLCNSVPSVFKLLTD
jgi:hypothetical protein